MSIKISINRFSNVNFNKRGGNEKTHFDCRRSFQLASPLRGSERLLGGYIISDTLDKNYRKER